MKQGYKRMLRRWRLEGWFSAGHGSLGPKGISDENVEVRNFHGQFRGRHRFRSKNPKVLHAYPSCYSLTFCPIWTFVPGQSITDQTSQQWRHSGIHPIWLHLKIQVVVWNQCSRVKGRGLANSWKTNSPVLQSAIPFPFSVF